MKLLYPVKLNKSWDLMESKWPGKPSTHHQILRKPRIDGEQAHQSLQACPTSPSMPNLHFSIPAIYKSIPHFETAML